MNEDAEDQAALRVWFAIRSLELEFERLLSRVPTQADRAEAWASFTRERTALAPHIESLREALHSALGDLTGRDPSLAEQCLCALLIQWDERELRALGEAGRGQSVELWQTRFCECYDGGERFFLYLEQALRLAHPPALALQIFLFCLRCGVCGRYASADHPERVAFEEELARRVAAEGPQPSAAATPRPELSERIAGARFPFSYYLAALAFLCGVWLLLRYDAHQEETLQLGSEPCKLK